ncbi:MAG TPA: helix-turn-helix transcriptional regulator [Clostridiales bacterium]|nr:helix-turn-helix transcriptional regulator [Clostridiales bacterium]
MKNVIFAGKCNGVGVSHVERDCDFLVSTGFYRNEYQIHYMLEGERFFYVGKKGCRMSKGALAFIDKEQIPFTNVIGGEYHNRILVELEEQWLKKADEAMEIDLRSFFQKNHGVILVHEDKRQIIESLLFKMKEVLGKQEATASAEVKIYILQIILMVMKGVGVKPEVYNIPEGKMLRYVKIREITNYIIGHCSEIYGLEDLARIFYMDKSYLSRIFKEVTNFTVNEFINCQRIGHAREYLLDPNLSIHEVSNKLGYESISYFDRVFKKYVGISPLQYRKSKLKVLKEDN